MRSSVNQSATETFTDEDTEDTLMVRYNNWGDPYREGIVVELEFNSDDGRGRHSKSVALEEREALRLRDVIDDMHGMPERETVRSQREDIAKLKAKISSLERKLAKATK